MIDLKRGDCLKRMAEIEDGSVDLVAVDLPYGTTQCRWDVAIPFEPLWSHYRRILKPDGAVVMTTVQPFTTRAVMSNPKWFRFDQVWDKVGPVGFLNANRQPLRRHESILLFAPSGRFAYRPQMGTGERYSIKNRESNTSAIYGAHRHNGGFSDGPRYPTSIVTISNANGKIRGKLHPTQKPVPLMEYLVKSYSDPGDLVVDNAMGSGSTGVACVQAGRRFIGIELDPDYFRKAKRRIAEAQGNAPPRADPARGGDVG